MTTHCSKPLAGTSTRCAEVMRAGPPGAASKLSSASAAHFCPSALCRDAPVAFCATPEEVIVRQRSVSEVSKDTRRMGTSKNLAKAASEIRLQASRLIPPINAQNLKLMPGPRPAFHLPIDYLSTAVDRSHPRSSQRAQRRVEERRHRAAPRL